MRSGSAAADQPHCQVVRALDVIGEKWSLLIVRDAFRGSTRYSEFRESLGAPSDILSARLAKLVDAGVLEKRGYREAGSRERFSYHLTESGRGLSVVLAALVQWGDEFAPFDGGPAWLVQDAEGRGLGLRFVDEAGAGRDPGEVRFRRGPAAPSAVAAAAPTSADQAGAAAPTSADHASSAAPVSADDAGTPAGRRRRVGIG